MNEPKKSVLISMADRFGMEPSRFEQVLRATVVPANCGPEQFAAFLLVAKQYGLNPITREIYAFPGKGGGIVPIVGVDGWMRILNDQPEFDGMEFEDKLNGEKLISITCRIYRKDRAHPTAVTEYMNECLRDTPTWKQWPARMLRHKAAIQAARYAFGFSGIMEPDEYERGFQDVKSAHKARKDGDWQVLMTELNTLKTGDELKNWFLVNKERISSLPLTWREHFDDEFTRRVEQFAKKEAVKPVRKSDLKPSDYLSWDKDGKAVVSDQPRKRGRPPKSAIKEQLKASVDALTVEPDTGEIIDDEIPSGIENPDKYLDHLESQLSAAKTVDDVNEVLEEYKLVMSNMFPPDRQKADALFDKHQTRVEG